jgi:catechol 2,3-dioxygenase-like lactoylglutathione lyase family enzyme
MSAVPAKVGAITLFVGDVQRSKAFYASLLERDPIYEDDVAATFRLEPGLLNLLLVSEAPELIEPAAVASEDPGARLLLTITVDDADAACAALAAKGIELLNGPVDRPWGVRTAAFADPDGHAWELAQPIGPGDASA